MSPHSSSHSASRQRVILPSSGSSVTSDERPLSLPLLLTEKRRCNSLSSESDDDSDIDDEAEAPTTELVLSALAASTRSKQRTKRVRWSTITIHEFGVGLGGSAVPSKGGASIGLAAAPEFTWTTRVGEMAECSEGVHRFSPDQRKRLLQGAGVEDVMIERYARETSIILGSRRRTFLEDLAADEREEKPRKRDAEQALLERPCFVYSRRPRMIPTNYV